MSRIRGGIGLLLGLLLGPAPAGPAWGRDLRDYGPSALLAPGESELKIFHNLYTQTEFFDEDGNRTDQGARSTWYTGTASLRWGWREGWNPGIELTVRHVKDRTRLPDFDSRSGLTAVTPNLQLLPSARVPSVTVRTGLRIPLRSDLEGDAREPFLDFEDPAWTLQLLHDRIVGPGLRLYLEAGSFLRIAGDDSQLTTPLKAIVNLEPGERWTLYVPLEVSPDWWGDGGGDYFTQAGIGGKLRPADGSAEVEVLWTAFPMGRNAGAGQTFNLGVRFVR